jgi:transcriptional regulator with XRE-family HTH domain
MNQSDSRLGEKRSEVSIKLKTLRAEHNLTQQDIAGRLGISQQTYSKYEKGSADIDSKTIIKVCDIYGVSSDYLLGIKRDDDVDGNFETVAYIDKIVEKVLTKINQNGQEGK